MTKLQHLKKFVEEADAAEVRQTPMITGDLKISGRMSHSAITSPKHPPPKGGGLSATESRGAAEAA
jgi:hypothetical protein